jgi:hypothetical protein
LENEKMLKVCAKLMVASVLAGVAVVANASPVHFDVATGTWNASGFAIGTTVDIKKSDGLDNVAFDLNEGQSQTFDFLDVALSGIGGAAGTIDATLSFAAPENAGNAGVLLAGFGVVLGYSAFGGLIPISLPDIVSFGNGGSFAVSFAGFGQNCLCSALAGTVTATVTLLKAPTSAPEPGTLSLLGAGLIAAALSRRRKRAAAV